MKTTVIDIRTGETTIRVLTPEEVSPPVVYYTDGTEFAAGICPSGYRLATEAEVTAFLALKSAMTPQEKMRRFLAANPDVAAAIG